MNTRCIIKRCHSVGRGNLGDTSLVFTWELGTCGSPLWEEEERKRGTCKTCHELGCEPEKVYEPATVNDVWTMTELTQEEVDERLARPPEEKPVDYG